MQSYLLKHDIYEYFGAKTSRYFTKFDQNLSIAYTWCMAFPLFLLGTRTCGQSFSIVLFSLVPKFQGMTHALQPAADS